MLDMITRVLKLPSLRLLVVILISEEVIRRWDDGWHTLCGYGKEWYWAAWQMSVSNSIQASDEYIYSKWLDMQGFHCIIEEVDNRELAHVVDEFIWKVPEIQIVFEPSSSILFSSIIVSPIE